MLPIPPVNTVPPIAPTDIAAAPSSVPIPTHDATLVERFNSIMQHLETSPQTHAHSHGPSAIGEFITQQDHEFQAVMQDAKTFAVSDPNNLQQMAQELIHMQNELTTLSFKMNIGTALAQSGKGSIQTLMKNQ